MRPPRIPHSILFVCLGNICRSPAAEIILRQKVAAASRAAEFLIDSAGVIGHHAGSPPDPRMSAALQQRGYLITGTARKIRLGDLAGFDLIVTMDETNLADVRGLDPSGLHHHKMRPFVGYCSRHSDPRVPDPYFGGQRGFDHVISLLEDGCDGILAATGADCLTV